MNEELVQDLSQFSQPANFRGRPAWFVQLWWLVQATIFRGSPQFLYGWRNFLLRMFGARIGRNVIIRPSVRIVYPWKLSVGDNSWIGDFAELYCLGEIEIGKNAVVSQQAYLCTGSHDFRKRSFDIFARPICIEDEAWVATGVFVHPGVTISRGSIVSARAVVRASTEPFCIYAGDPALKIGERPR